MTLLVNSNHPGSPSSFIHATNRSVQVGGISFAYATEAEPRSRPTNKSAAT